ncbi:MAG: hypothetical protein U9O85_01760 [Euryarchaeota archaeon]|nr:hypothetical protein [Euryarchaeota archaeon]
MKIKKALAALFILAFVALAGYFLYPILQSGEIQSSFQAVGEEFFNPNVTEKTLSYSKASGAGVCLVNYKNATDPTWGELIAFLKRDDTDKHPYNFSSFVCADFAEMLHNNAESSGIKAAWVAVDFELTPYPLYTPSFPTLYPFHNATDDKKPGYGISIPGEGHALNAFNTTDKGLVYVDCTRGFSTPTIAELTDSEERRECEHDKITYVVEGKEYGLISIDKATSPEYCFYEEYTEKCEEYDRELEAYNSDVEAYNNDVEAYERDGEVYERALRGRTIIRDPLEYERLNKMYNDLKARENELDIRGTEFDARREGLDEQQEELGYYRWESLGVVTNVEVYW